jgi:histidine ammonia-lyase
MAPGADPVCVGLPISLCDLEDVAVRGRRVVFRESERGKVVRSRAAIDAIARAGDDAPRVYGVNTRASAR